MMGRRTCIAVLLSAFLVVPLKSHAQVAGKVYQVGFLWDRPTVWPEALEAFRQRLRDLDWVEGKNIEIEYRWANGRFDLLPSLADLPPRLVPLSSLDHSRCWASGDCP